MDRHAGRVAAQVREAAGGHVDVVIDVVGGPLFSSWPGLLGPHGRIVVAGAVAGPLVELDLRQFYLDQRRIIGSSMHTPSHFAELVALAREGELTIPVAETFQLDRIAEAQAVFRSGELVGKVVVELPSVASSLAGRGARLSRCLLGPPTQGEGPTESRGRYTDEAPSMRPEPGIAPCLSTARWPAGASVLGPSRIRTSDVGCSPRGKGLLPICLRSG